MPQILAGSAAPRVVFHNNHAGRRSSSSSGAQPQSEIIIKSRRPYKFLWSRCSPLFVVRGGARNYVVQATRIREFHRPYKCSSRCSPLFVVRGGGARNREVQATRIIEFQRPYKCSSRCASLFVVRGGGARNKEVQQGTRSSGGSMGVAKNGPPVIKAPSDERLYEVVHLENGLTALLIHDPLMADSGSEVASGVEEDGDEDGDEGEDEEGEDDEEEESGEEEDGREDGMECDEVNCSADDHHHPHSHSKETSNAANGGEETEGEDEEESDGEAGGSAKRSPGMAPTKKAAAAMCVGVGSFSDPPDAQGLAHFLEHMLFMGSSKYPDENEYDFFLSKHGGGSNAFTDTEYTCYHFAVNHRHLKPALDRFSQFFISPLAKADAMDREVQAIDSEFQQVLQSDSCRLLQLQCHTADPKHPFHTFSWGNKVSLGTPMAKGVDMRGKMLELYKDYYLAGRMKLVVLGGEPLETLKKWVTEFFGEVRGGKDDRLSFPWTGPVWEKGRLYKLESVKDQHLLSLMWPLPCLQSSYLKKPQDYISHLVGHEGAGSLLSLLKQKGWATALSAGVGDSGYDRSTAGYMFNANVHLTVAGLDKLQDVIGLFFQYIKMLKNNGPQDWVFKELQAMGMMEFRFAEEESADNYVVRLACTDIHLGPASYSSFASLSISNTLLYNLDIPECFRCTQANMHLYTEEEHIIYGDYAFEEWDPELVNDLLAIITPNNMRLDVVSRQLDRNSPDVLVEPWFEGPYTVDVLAESLLQVWADPPHVDSALHMPKVNEFIPHDFSIRTATQGADTSDVPVILLDAPSVKVWYKLDKTFKTPRANAYFSITLGAASKSLKACVLTEVYVKILGDSLNEILYLANVAKLESSMSFSGDKFDLKLFGFNEKLPVLALKIAEVYKTFVPSEDRFQAMKEDLERGYRNTNMRPLKQSAYLRLQVLKERFWHVDEKLSCLLSLSLQDVIDFIPWLFDQEEALNIVNIFKDTFFSKELPPELRPREMIYKLPAGIHILDAHVKNESEDNSVVEMYFQLEQELGLQSLRFRALLDLFEEIIYEPCFNQLRTKEQLGYRVDCGVRLTHRIFGFCFRVQSSKYSPPFLQQRINAFVGSIQQTLVDMSDEEFASYKEALIAEKMERDHSLLDETDRHWEQIWDQRYVFEARKLEALEVRTLQKNDLINWFAKHLGADAPSQRKLSIHIWGSKSSRHGQDLKLESTDQTNTITDLIAFKNSMELYPVLI